MTVEVHYILEVFKKKYRFFSEPTKDGGQVGFVSFVDEVQQACNINHLPFENSPVEVAGRSTIAVGNVKNDAPQGDLLFYMNSVRDLFMVGVEPYGTDIAYLGAHKDGELRALQGADVKLGDVVKIVMNRKQVQGDLTVQICNPNGEVLDSFPCPHGEKRVSHDFTTHKDMAHYVLRLKDDTAGGMDLTEAKTILQTGGTSQGDLIIPPPGG